MCQETILILWEAKQPNDTFLLSLHIPCVSLSVIPVFGKFKKHVYLFDHPHMSVLQKASDIPLDHFLLNTRKLMERLSTFTNRLMRVSQGGSLFPCSLPKLPYVPMFPHIFRMFSYCNFSNFVPLFPKIG